MSLAAFHQMLEHDRHRAGLPVARAAWLFGVTVREYRELEAGEREATWDTYHRIATYFGWPESYAPTAKTTAKRRRSRPRRIISTYAGMPKP
jgi:hypothetical protein